MATSFSKKGVSSVNEVHRECLLERARAGEGEKEGERRAPGFVFGVTVLPADGGLERAGLTALHSAKAPSESEGGT